MSIGIYKITSLTGKVYIGQSTNLEKRKDDYVKLRCNKQPKLYNSLKTCVNKRWLCKGSI